MKRAAISLRVCAKLDEVRSLEAGQLLRRAGAVFDRSDDALLLKLAAAEPPLRNAGDAIAVLNGVWLEILPHDDVRVSPLIADIASDVPATDLRAWRRLAALHWLENRTLDKRTLPLCFWNAFWGEHDGVLMKLCEVMQANGARNAARGCAHSGALFVPHH